MLYLYKQCPAKRANVKTTGGIPVSYTHLSVTMMVPRMGSLFLKRIVFKPKAARGRKEEIFMGEHPFF